MDNPVRVLKCIIEITDVSYDKGRNLKTYSKKLGCHSSRQIKKKLLRKEIASYYFGIVIWLLLFTISN